jgi:hypothetical protein
MGGGKTKGERRENGKRERLATNTCTLTDFCPIPLNE